MFLTKTKEWKELTALFLEGFSEVLQGSLTLPSHSIGVQCLTFPESLSHPSGRKGLDLIVCFCKFWNKLFHLFPCLSLSWS